jgi:hypothetical protein
MRITRGLLAQSGQFMNIDIYLDGMLVDPKVWVEANEETGCVQMYALTTAGYPRISSGRVLTETRTGKVQIREKCPGALDKVRAIIEKEYVR